MYSYVFMYISDNVFVPVLQSLLVSLLFLINMYLACVTCTLVSACAILEWLDKDLDSSHPYTYTY